ncbi:unnamed protein product [Dibothriocephalus latus]|uniref:Uncharacterized protein n=1 Tax=Dibothriocephalus latus TaxID=60516 RepID=A0A3P7L4Z8_DIBLA|nr:unnamed protein product [Dibothriocephalus latus]
MLLGTLNLHDSDNRHFQVDCELSPWTIQVGGIGNGGDCTDGGQTLQSSLEELNSRHGRRTTGFGNNFDDGCMNRAVYSSRETKTGVRNLY